MNPAARLSVALMVALVLWWPTMSATVRGELGLPEGALRYLAAFLFTRLAIEGLALLVRQYAPEAESGAGTDEPAEDGMTTAGAS